MHVCSRWSLRVCVHVLHLSQVRLKVTFGFRTALQSSILGQWFYCLPNYTVSKQKTHKDRTQRYVSTHQSLQMQIDPLSWLHPVPFQAAFEKNSHPNKHKNLTGLKHLLSFIKHVSFHVALTTVRTVRKNMFSCAVKMPLIKATWSYQFSVFNEKSCSLNKWEVSQTCDWQGWERVTALLFYLMDITRQFSKTNNVWSDNLTSIF